MNKLPLAARLSFPIVLSIGLLLGCAKQPADKVPLAQATITGISPTSAAHGEIITILGKNLLKDSAGFRVTINSKQAAIRLFSNDSIKAIVPDNAGTGNVVIYSGGTTHPGPELQYNYEVIVTTIAGNGSVGKSDGNALGASFNCPWGITADDDENLFIADCYNRLIRIYDKTSNTVKTIDIPVTIGGSGGSQFYSPYNITQDKKSKSLYVTDFNKHVLKVGAGNDLSVIFVDSMPLAGIAMGPDANLYISNNTTGQILKIDTLGKTKSIFSSGLVTPRNIIFDKNNAMFVSGYGIYKVNSNGSNQLVQPPGNFKGWETAVDTAGNFYQADHFNNNILKIDKKGVSTVIAGNGKAQDVDGIGLDASFNGPQGLTIDKEGNLYVTTFNYTDNTGNKIRKISFR